MSQPKFKVGDRVSIVKGYPANGKRHPDASVGLTTKVRRIVCDTKEEFNGLFDFHYKVECNDWTYDEQALLLFIDEDISYLIGVR